MSFQGVNVIPGQGNLKRTNPTTDAVMALVVVIENLPVDVEEHVFYVFNDIKQAEDIGINAAYDANENRLVHHHIDEFFRLAPDGTLKVVFTTQPTAEAFFGQDVVKALFRSQTDAKRIGFVYNENVVGLVLATEIAKCQLFINDLAADKIYLNGIYLEARNVSKTAVTRRTLGCGKVSLVIAQDPLVASIDVAYENYAAVGSILGMRAVRKPNENLGSVDIIKKPNAKKGTNTYPLTDDLLGKWLSCSLSDGTPVSSLTKTEQNQLTAFGYIYAGTFQGFPGVYLNGEPTCIALSSDYSSGENNGVWDKAALGIRTALLPKVRGWFQRTPVTGELKSTAITALENEGRKPLQAMVVANEISAFDLMIPSPQSPNDTTPLNVKASVTLGAIIHEFEVDLSLV